MQDRINELAELVNYHSNLYFNDSMPEITDGEFDAFVRELTNLDSENPALASVGAMPSYGKTVTHPSKMGSLKKVPYDTGELDRVFVKKYKKYGFYSVGPKIDGLAVRLTYVNGNLIQAATRGNGDVGQDVTDNVRHIDAIPQAIDGFSGELRGEIYMSRAVFEKSRQMGGRIFANPRNAAAGTLNQKIANKTGNYPLNFFCYDIMQDGVVFHTESQKAEAVANFGSINYVPLEQAETISDIRDIITKWQSERSTLNYDIDGMVISIDSIDSQEDLGWVGKYPNGKIAYKFKPEQVSGVNVNSIDYQVGRTGKLTPMARIEPTEVDGSVISNITLHNLNMMKQLKVSVGAKVTIEKAGDIIPQIVRVDVEGDGNINYPNFCPCCGEVTIEDDRGVSVWCRNPICEAKLEERFNYFVKAFDIKGVGPALIGSLVKEGIIKELYDLFYLNLNELANITGGSKSAQKINVAILEKGEVPLHTFLQSLGIHGLGRTTSKSIAKKYSTLDNIRNLNSEELEKFDGIGEITATSICGGLYQMENVINGLLKCIDIEEQVVINGGLTGEIFCLTGSFSRKKAELHKMIEASGGEIATSVRKDITYLVQSDPTSQTSKTKKAEKYGIAVIGEDELMEMLS